MGTQEKNQALLDFLKASPSPFHAVDYVRKELDAAGFQQLKSSEAWQLESEKAYYVVRGGSLIAWIQGKNEAWEEQGGFLTAGAHTDSPCLKLKLKTSHYNKGNLVVKVAMYGSPILSTYTDKGLGVAGIAVKGSGSKLETRLIHIDEPVAILPNLAIHLNREVNNKQSYNPQTQLHAVFAHSSPGEKTGNAEEEVRKILGVEEDEICDLHFFQAQSPCILGARQQFFSGSRLDDLSMAALLYQNLIEQYKNKEINGPTSLITLMSGEEVGSRTYEGAASNFMADTLRRIVSCRAAQKGLNNSEELWQRSQNRSYFFSLDGAHATHPSYTELFEPNYDLLIGSGPAIKYPNGASYASESFGIAFIQGLCAEHRIPYQTSMPRADKPTGSTIGPILCSALGFRGVDMGLPMYAMHSQQETVAVSDYHALARLVKVYYQSVELCFE